MADAANLEAVRAHFGSNLPGLEDVAGRFSDDPSAVLAQAEARFQEMIPTLGYADEPTHPMAGALFTCTVYLSLFDVLRECGVDAHAFGAAMLEAMAASFARSGAAPELTAEVVQAFITAAEASQRNPRRGEFVFELVAGDADSDWGMNVTSCAICHQFSKHDAMSLVPYMCASDDVESDAYGQGLRRTGTIALGAHRCDFRYGRGRPGHHVVDQFPEAFRGG